MTPVPIFHGLIIPLFKIHRTVLILIPPPSNKVMLRVIA
jgi:hypothetical protein